MLTPLWVISIIVSSSPCQPARVCLMTDRWVSAACSISEVKVEVRTDEKKNKYAEIRHDFCISNPLKRMIVWFGRTKLAIHVG